ncbi:hypothetical protein AHF37_01404 [Paragonimus kellicotti]|nr:hypothetical protein AHF37_01404 [Paragonimus kellicotti]
MAVDSVQAKLEEMPIRHSDNSTQSSFEHTSPNHSKSDANTEDIVLKVKLPKPEQAIFNLRLGMSIGREPTISATREWDSFIFVLVQ